MNTEISHPADKSVYPLNNSNVKSLNDLQHEYITLMETFDVDKLNYIIENFEDFRSPLLEKEILDNFKISFSSNRIL